MKLPSLSQRFGFVGLIVLVLLGTTAARSQSSYEFNDSHFHLTNNIQDGPDIHDFLNMMGSKAGRVALSGIPLQQQWSYRVDGSRAPTYYLHSDAPLYYYSFTDARIAMGGTATSMVQNLSPSFQRQSGRIHILVNGFMLRFR